MNQSSASQEVSCDFSPVVKLNVRSFAENFATYYPKYIEYLCSTEIKNSPFGSVIPYRNKSLFQGDSCGHCVRIDAVVTKKGGVFVSEVDYVPSGRGFLLVSLPEHQRKVIVQQFAQWYQEMGLTSVFYGHGSKTICDQEVQFFVEKMKEHSNLEFAGGNVEAVDLDLLSRRKTLIDRLFYRSEISPSHLIDSYRSMSTAESFLDSKATLAPVHFPLVASEIAKCAGDDGLDFLKGVIPEMQVIPFMSENQIGALFDLAKGSPAYKDLVFKGSGVEADNSWGCRSVMMGCGESASSIRRALNGNHKSKDLSINPVVQKFIKSKNFRRLWNQTLDGQYARIEGGFGNACAELTHAGDDSTVSARVGMYFLINRVSCTATYLPYGLVTLRESHFVHGASDAMTLPFEIA